MGKVSVSHGQDLLRHHLGGIANPVPPGPVAHVSQPIPVVHKSGNMIGHPFGIQDRIIDHEPSPGLYDRLSVESLLAVADGQGHVDGGHAQGGQPSPD